MTEQATITYADTVLARHLEVELEVQRDPGGAEQFAGAFEAPRDWPLDCDGPFVLHLSDGRQGAFVPTRRTGADLGGALVLFNGIEVLHRGASCDCVH